MSEITYPRRDNLQGAHPSCSLIPLADVAAVPLVDEQVVPHQTLTPTYQFLFRYKITSGFLSPRGVLPLANRQYRRPDHGPCRLSAAGSQWSRFEDVSSWEWHLLAAIRRTGVYVWLGNCGYLA
jgi:hypothetical protein